MLVALAMALLLPYKSASLYKTLGPSPDAASELVVESIPIAALSSGSICTTKFVLINGLDVWLLVTLRLPI